MKYLFCLIAFLTFKASAQSAISWIDDFKSGDRIYTYGLEDYPTIELYKRILSDTNNIIVIEGGYFQFIEWIKNSNAFISDESKICDGISSSLKEMNGIKAYNCSYRTFGNDLQFLEFLNPIKFDSVVNQFGLNKTETLKGNIPIDKQEMFIQESVNRNSFSLIDSLLLAAVVYKKVLEADDFVKAGINKKIFFVRDYLSINSQSRFETNLIGNSYLCIPRKGSNNLRGSNLNCKNRLPKKQEFEKLNFADLPLKVRFSKRIKIRKKDYKEFTFIYIDKLNNCLW